MRYLPLCRRVYNAGAASHISADTETAPHFDNNDKKKIRSSGLDIVRSIACITVIASHFFIYTDLYETKFEGLSLFLQGMLCSIAVGSDLYMILTGFLCSNKVYGKKFYLSGVKVLVSYVFFSVLTIIVNIYIFHTDMTWQSGLLGILSFSTIPYAWYIEMWIGLFMMAPFLNIWYKALPDKKMKLILIGILISLSAFPDFFNRYERYYVPEFWEFIYPLAFYFIGCFIKEYRPIVSNALLIGLILVVSAISPVATIIMGKQTFLPFIGSRCGFFMASIALSIFLLFYNRTIKHKHIAKAFKAISLRSLDIFLCSALLDFYIYPLFKKLYFVNQTQFGIYYFVIVPLIFIVCYLIATIKRIPFYWIDRIMAHFSINVSLQNKG